VSALLEELGNEETSDLTSRIFAFVLVRFNSETGASEIFMDYQRNWLEENGSDDSHRPHLVGPGYVLGRSNRRPFRVWPLGIREGVAAICARAAHGPGPLRSSASTNIFTARR